MPVDPTDVARRDRLHRALLGAARWGDASSLDTVVEQRSTFSEAEVAAWWAQAPVRSDAHVNHVYVHVPFCKSICTFCNYKRLRPSSPELLRQYLNRLEGSLRTLGPALARHRFHTLYLGGGTPTVLPAQQLGRLLDLLDAHVPFVPGGRRVIEADPAVLGEGRARVLASHGVHHVSMGVQSLDPAVIAAHDRGRQDEDLVGKRVAELRAAGIRELSFDLLLGMAGTTPEGSLADLERLIARFEPAWVDVYALTPTERYLAASFEGDFEAFRAWQTPFLAEVDAAIPGLARRLGYHLGGSPGHHWSLRRHDGEAGPVARALGRVATAVHPVVSRLPGGQAVAGRVRGWVERVGAHGGPSYTQLVSEQQAPMHLLGLGYSARSRIAGTARFVYEDPDDDPLAEGPAHYVGSRITPDDEARSYLLHMWRDARPVSPETFEHLFERPLASMAGEALARWEAAGWLTRGREGIVVSLGARDEGLRRLLWLFDEDTLEESLAQRRGIDRSAEAIAARLAPHAVGDEVSPGWRWVDVRAGTVVVEGPGGRRAEGRVVPDTRADHGATLVDGPGSQDGAAALGVLRAALQGSGWGHDGTARRRPRHPAAQR